MSWENYGDVNPVEHGGVFVKHDKEIGGRCFYIVKLDSVDDGNGEQWHLINGYIDLDDDWIEWESVKSTMDIQENTDDESLAVDLIHYYGTHLSNGAWETHYSEKDVLNRLEQLEINLESV